MGRRKRELFKKASQHDWAQQLLMRVGKLRPTNDQQRYGKAAKRAATKRSNRSKMAKASRRANR